MPPFPSLLAHLSLPHFSLPHFSLPWTKRHDTMDPNPWNLLLKCTLKESTSITLHLYTNAAEDLLDPDALLERLDVVWIWQLKTPKPPFHKFSHRNGRPWAWERGQAAYPWTHNIRWQTQRSQWGTLGVPPNNINNLFLGQSRAWIDRVGFRQPRAIHIHILPSCFDSLPSIVASRYRKFGLSWICTQFIRVFH